MGEALLTMLAATLLVGTILVVIEFGSTGAQVMAWLALIVCAGFLVASAIVSENWAADSVVVDIVSFLIAAVGAAHGVIALVLFGIARWLRGRPDPHHPSSSR